MSWKAVKLEKLCKMNSGGTPSRSIKEYYSGDIPWAKISDIEAAEGGIVYSTEEHITKEGLNAINNRIFEKGTLLLAMYGSVGKVAFTGVDMSTNQAILGIRIIDETVLDYSYLKYWFQTIKSKLLDRAVGGTLQNISLGIVKDLEIPLPPLATQKRIAEILDAADALRRKDQELLKKYDELAQAIFIDMFGDPVKNEKGWDVKTIQDVINVDRPITYGILKPGENIKPKGVPYIRVVDIKGQKILTDQVCFTTIEISNQYRRSLLKEGDILYSIRGHVGRSCVVPKAMSGANITQDTARLDFTGNLSNIFAFGYLNTLAFDRIVRPLVRGAAVKGLNLGDLRELPIPIPPIDLQLKYERIMNLNWQQNNFAKESKLDSYILFDTLIQKAFNGELFG